MPHKAKRFTTFGLITVLAAGLIIGLGACSSPAAPAAPATTATTTPLTTGTGAPSAPRGNYASRWGGSASGTITAIEGSTITLDTGDGPAKVIVSANTSIQKYAAGSLADLQTGQFLTVTGTADASGNTAATSITVRPQDANSRFSFPGGNMPGQGGRSGPTGGPGTGPSSSGSGNFSFGRPGGGGFNASGNGAFGMLSNIDGNTLKLTNVQGQEITVTVGPDTAIRMIENGSLADLHVGDAVIVMGNRDDAGDIDAFLISIGAGSVFPGGN